MLILVDATAAAQNGAGIVTYVSGLIRGWKDAGFDDRWIVLGTSDLADAVVDGMRGFGEVVLSGTGGALSRIAAQHAALPALVRSRRPDVVLSTTPVVPGRVEAPAVAVVHDLRHLERPQDFGRFQNWYRRRVWHAGLRRAARLIADSERTRRDLVSHYPFAEAKARTILLGSDHVPAVGPQNAAGHGIAFARWANKRPDFAVQTWAHLQKLEPGLDRSLHVVGVGSAEIAGIRTLAHELGVADLVQVHPFLPDEVFWELFRTAAVVLFPSHFEGFGLPVVEAMRLGIPVVTWQDPAVAEVAGQWAFYAEPSPEDFARQVQTVLHRDGAVERRLKKASARARTLTWRRTAEQTRQALVEAVAEAARSNGRPQRGR